MNEQPTTDAPVQDEGAITAQPPVEQQAEAETPVQEPTDTSTQEPAEADNSAEDDLSDYWNKKGIDITTPEGQAQAAKSYREAEKAMHQKSQQASELEKQINGPTVDPDASRADQAYAIAQQLQNEKVIREWKESNNVTKEEDDAMGEYAKANPRTAELLVNGQLTLDEFRAIAVPGQKVDTSAIKQEGGQEALEKLANKQRATAVQGNASSSTPATSLNKGNVEQWYEQLGSAGRQDPANQAILQSILSS